MIQKYDLIVLGGGPGGYVASIRAAQFGLKVLLVEANEVGGTCLNRGCIPTKSLLTSAHLLFKFKKCNEFGIKADNVSFDINAIVKRKDDIVLKLREGILKLIKANKITLINGFGKLISENKINVLNGEYEFDKLIIATGSIPASLPNNLRPKNYIINSDDALNLTNLPNKLLIIGGGVVGVELANYFSFLGVDVTIVELMPNLLPYEDSSLGKRLASIFKKYGIKVKTNTKVIEVKENIEKKGVDIKFDNDEEVYFYDLVIEAIGRKRVIDDIGLLNANVETDGKKIKVNKFLQTSNPNIYAIGDCASDIMLAHYAMHQGLVAAHNVSCKDLNNLQEFDVNAPSCIYTIPEIASFGLTSEKAKKLGIEVNSGKFSFQMLGRALSIGEPEGFVEIFTEPKTNIILGANIFGPHASELICCIQTATINKLKANELCEKMMFAHPTLSEAIFEAALDTYKFGIHTISLK